MTQEIMIFFSGRIYFFSESNSYTI